MKQEEMKKANPQKELYLSGIFLTYLLPILLLSLWESIFSSPFFFFSFGLLISSFGTCFLFFFIPKIFPFFATKAPLLQPSAKETLQASFPQSEEIPDENAVDKNSFDLEEAIKQKDQQIEALSQEILDGELKLKQILLQNQEEKETIETKISQYISNLEEDRKRLSEQKELLDKKQQHIQELETKIFDLTYEIKTLINLTDPSSSAPLSFIEEPFDQPEKKLEEEIEFDMQVKTEEQASLLLKRCLDIAQKITSSNHFSQTSPRFRDFPLHSSTLDLRRLIDALKSESGAGILLYSQKDTKALFVNQMAKTLLGFTQEQFLHSFHEIFQGGVEEWNLILQDITTPKEIQRSVYLNTKGGQTVQVHFSLGKIFNGIFKNHVLAVFYLQQTSSSALNAAL